MSPPAQGAWIEIVQVFHFFVKNNGRPLHRGRGLK